MDDKIDVKGKVNQEKHIDLVIHETKSKILDTLNSSKLPVSVVRLIVNEINEAANIQYNMRINNLTKK
ncbi:hypothetical protein [Senegalia massiliensis]|uniref:Uncharacterized protein n=1 Tax=Senegalia massiliensis TaxID=1720316 RepID=A0A845R427_9CLOT|nr:hypothetical protein [Senegalia massiliensis]NBI08368.1 hypothetical protein [Senegalia massiliensis]